LTLLVLMNKFCSNISISLNLKSKYFNFENSCKLFDVISFNFDPKTVKSSRLGNFWPIPDGRQKIILLLTENPLTFIS